MRKHLFLSCQRRLASRAITMLSYWIPACAGMTIFLSAAEANATKITFDQAVATVRDKSFDVMRARIDLLMAKTDQTKIATALSPFGQFFYQDVTNSQSISSRGLEIQATRAQQAGITLGYNLTEALVGIFKLWAQDTQIKITDEQKEQVLIGTAFGVAQTYRLTQAAEKSVEVAKSRLGAGSKQLKDTEALFAYGKISKSDKLEIELNYNNSVIGLTTSQNDLRKSQTALKKLLAIDDDEPLELDKLADLKADAVATIMTESEAVQKAFANRGDLAISKLIVSGVDTQKWLLLKPYLPTTTAQMDFRWNFGNLSDFVLPQTQAFTLNLTWNFWDGGSAITDYRKTYLQARRYEVDLREKTLDVKNDAEQAVRDLQLAKETLRLRDVGIAKAEEAYRGYSTRYSLGAVSVTELLFSENTLNQARLDHLSATVGLDIANMKLQKATGMKLPVPL